MKLLERDSFLHELDAALNEAAAGQGQIVLISGEAGIGKTSLVEHFTHAHLSSTRVLWGACDSLFTPRPLGPLLDIAVQLEGEIPSLLNSNADRQAIFSACLVELQTRPTILVFEDIHWADEATLDVIKFLGRRIQSTVTLFILTYRDDELSAEHPLRLVLGDLPGAASRRLHLSPLSMPSVFALASAEKQAARAYELFETTSGNPFFVTEALASKEAGIPSTVRDAVLARAARLSPSARAVLEAAAVIGSRVEPWLLSKIFDLGNASIEECISRGILQTQGDYYAFRHELARQTILESLSAQRKITLHRLALNALKESPETRDDLARLANHAQETKDANAVLEYAPAAARRASTLGAHRQAVAHYKTALQYASLLSAEGRAELLDKYSDECEVNAQMIEARNAQQEALSLWQELGRREKEGRALRRLSEIVMRLYQKDETHRYATEAIAVLEALPPSRELAMAYSHKSRIYMVIDQVDETVFWGKRAMELAEHLGDNEALIHALSNVGTTQLSHNQHTEGLINLRRSLRLSLNHDYHYQAGRTYYNLAYGLIALHDYETSLTYVNEGLDYCTKHDLDNWRFRLLSLHDQAQFEQGHWAELDTSPNQMDLPFLMLQVRRGNPISTETLDSMRKIASNTVFQERIYPIIALFAEMAWLQGDLAKCRAEVELMFEIVCQLNVPREIGELAYWMWRAGAITEAPPNAAEPYATQIAGKWKEAAAMWEEYGCPYEQAMALMDGDEAAQLAALEIFERLGARPAMELLKQKMRAEGFRIPRGPRPATREHPFGFTDREMEVLSCLVEGSTNRAIARKLNISNRTAEHHIASILRKMGVPSRGEAVELAVKDKLLPSE